MIEFGIDDVDRRHPEISLKAGRGLTFAVGDRKTLIVHRDADAHLGGYIGLRVPPQWFEAEGLQALDAKGVRQRLCDEFRGWSEDLLAWIQVSSGPLTPRPIYELPSGHCWKQQAGITLIGDAAHVMSPFGGEVANLALLDGAELAEALLESDWQNALYDFERKMWSRAGQVSSEASKAIQAVFATDGLQHILRQMLEHGPPSDEDQHSLLPLLNHDASSGI